MSTTALVSINDQQITAMLNNPAMRRQFPFLATAHKRISSGQAKGCNTCGGKKKGNQAEYAEIKRSIAQMDVEKKAKLKQALGARQVQVSYKPNARKKVTLKF